MADHNEFGKLAEELAESFLVQKNYKILAKNFRYQKAEIDIIAEFENQIIIVEVKARKTDAFMLPQEAINKRKIKLIVSAQYRDWETDRKSTRLNSSHRSLSLMPSSA